MYLTILERLKRALAAHIQENYGEELSIVLEKPPKLELGEAASPVCFELAKRLKKAPRMIAQEIAASLPAIPGIARVEVAGAGYLNAFFDRAAFWEALWSEVGAAAKKVPGRIIVEHTSINPNKAAHIGHLRNAVLGDTMVRLLKDTGHEVAVQNYIDNTGVQVADVVIAFREMERKSLAEVTSLSKQAKFDYLCWDLYAKATQYFAENKEQAGKWRGETLKAIEEGGDNEIAKMGAVIADSVVSSHLHTMARLDIYYELLARESEILHLHFWDAAFEKLKASGAIVYSTGGKTAGCWIMPWNHGGSPDGEEANEEDQAKIIVRSNGTVTYVGKDIAYQLWKFGLLGKDFNYRRWPDAPGGRELWATTTSPSDVGAPHFGAATAVYNVIDARQAYLQDVVGEGVRALGHPKEAENSIHFAYEIVALTPRCAKELGYELSDEEAKKSYVEVSGRKGLGVKADDLIDRMLKAAETRVQQKHADMAGGELRKTSSDLAVGALRFFLLKYTRNTIIAFDFEDALSAEGETGPYCQYAIVRIRGIRRKGAGEAAAKHAEISAGTLNAIMKEQEAVAIWELLLQAGSLDNAVQAAIAAQEPAFVTKYAFQLAQAFNNFYHKHHILTETDEQKRAFLLGLTQLVEQQLVKALALLGIQSPERM